MIHWRLATLACIAGLAACTTKPPIRTSTEQGSSGLSAASQTGVTTRRVWSGPNVELDGASPSPDGRLFAFSDANTGNLVVRDLVSGRNRTLTFDSTATGREWVFSAAFAPDGRRIAFSFADASHAYYQLRLVDADGTGARVLVADTSIGYFGPPAWSPDGREIAAVITRDKVWSIALVVVETGALRTIKSFPQRGVVRVVWSPDGRFLAYDQPRTEGNHARDIHVIAIDGGLETRITDDVAWDEVVGWSPAGDQLLFFSDREGTDGAWGAPVTGGGISGRPKLVRRDLWNSWPLGLSRSALFYGVTLEDRANFVATIDVEHARLVVAPVRYPTKAIPQRIPDWSPDGRSIAFGISSDHAARIGIRSLSGNEVREIETPLDYPPLDVRWAPDGKSILAASSEGGKDGVYRIDLVTGRTELVVAGGGNGAAAGSGPEPSRDGKTLFLGRRVADNSARALIARDLATGTERELTRFRQFGSLILSPNGQDLALITASRSTDNHVSQEIRIVPTSGGDGRVVHKAESPTATLSTFGGLAWSKDGRHLLYVRIKPDHSAEELMLIAAEGGESQILFTLPRIGGIRLNADGRRILFNSGTFKGELWVMENFPTAGGGPAK